MCFPLVYGNQDLAHYWVGGTTVVLACVSLLIIVEMHSRRTAVENVRGLSAC